MSIVITSKCGPDGKLHLEIPVGHPGWEYEVIVTAKPKLLSTHEVHLEFLNRTAGAWQGDFEPVPSLPAQERESF